MRATDAQQGLFPNGRPSVGAVFWRFLGYGAHAFGGPVVQIAMLREQLVGRERWTTHETFTRALAVYQALPGPEAHEMCCWFGHLARGRLGAVAAGLGFMLPGFALMLLAAWLYASYGLNEPWVTAAFSGVQIAALALLVRALPKLASHALKVRGAYVVATVAFVSEWIAAPFWMPMVFGAMWCCAGGARGTALRVVAAALCGAALWRYAAVSGGNDIGDAIEAPEALVADGWNLFVTGLKGGLLTFGGAYCAIPFVRADVVTKHAWLSDGQFLDGLAIGGVLPAPLVIFATFAGFVADAWIGAFAITVGMFLPSFSFTLVGHRFVDRLVHAPRFHAALDGVAAAVVGIVTVTAVRLCMDRFDGLFSIAVFVVAWAVLVRARSLKAIPLVMAAAAVAGVLAR